MSRSPFRQRPNFYLTLTPRGGSAATSRSETPMPTPTGTPFATTSYSPFASADLKPPKAIPFPRSDSYDAAMPFKHRSRGMMIHKKYDWLRSRRFLASKPIWLFLMSFALMLWWFNGVRQALDVVDMNARGFGKEFIQGRRMQDYQFYPASNPKIHVRGTVLTLLDYVTDGFQYTGRWTSTPNRLRKDGAFPGTPTTLLQTSSDITYLKIRRLLRCHRHEHYNALLGPSQPPGGLVDQQPNRDTDAYASSCRTSFISSDLYQ